MQLAKSAGILKLPTRSTGT